MLLEILIYYDIVVGYILKKWAYSNSSWPALCIPLLHICVCCMSLILLQRSRMSDDSVEDTKKGPLAEMTDDSCTLEFIEILPIGTASHYYHTLEDLLIQLLKSSQKTYWM